MMRNLAFVLMALVCFGSCRKDDPTPTPKPKPDKEEPPKRISPRSLLLTLRPTMLSIRPPISP